LYVSFKLTFLIAIILFVQGSMTTCLAVQPQKDRILSQEEIAFLVVLNRYRQQYNLAPLQISKTLCAAAQWMSTDLSRREEFSHTDSLGRTLGKRLLAFGYHSNEIRENILEGTQWGIEAFEDWRNSPGHNENLLAPDSTEIGIACVPSPESEIQCFWTCVFGSNEVVPPPPSRLCSLLQGTETQLPDMIRVPLNPGSPHLAFAESNRIAGDLRFTALHVSKGGAGLQNHNALIETKGRNSSSISIALDTLRKTDDFPSCIRIDTTGHEDFTDSVVIPIPSLKANGSRKSSFIASMPYLADGSPGTVYGFVTYSADEKKYEVYLAQDSARVGQFVLNGESYYVWFHDSNGDGVFSNRDKCIVIVPSQNAGDDILPQNPNSDSTGASVIVFLGGIANIHRTPYIATYKDGVLTLMKYTGHPGYINFPVPMSISVRKSIGKASTFSRVMVDKGRMPWLPGSYQLNSIRSFTQPDGSFFRIFYNQYADTDTTIPGLFKYTRNLDIISGNTTELAVFPFRVLVRAHLEKDQLVIESRVATSDGRGNVAINSDRMLFEFVVADSNNRQLLRSGFQQSDAATAVPYKWHIPSDVHGKVTVKIVPLADNKFLTEYETADVNIP